MPDIHIHIHGEGVETATTTSSPPRKTKRKTKSVKSAPEKKTRKPSKYNLEWKKQYKKLQTGKNTYGKAGTITPTKRSAAMKRAHTETKKKVK